MCMIMHFPLLSTYHYELIAVHSLIFAIMNQIVSLKDKKRSIYLAMFDFHVLMSIRHLKLSKCILHFLILFFASEDFQLFLKVKCFKWLSPVLREPPSLKFVYPAKGKLTFLYDN